MQTKVMIASCLVSMLGCAAPGSDESSEPVGGLAEPLVEFRTLFVQRVGTDSAAFGDTIITLETAGLDGNVARISYDSQGDATALTLARLWLLCADLNDKSVPAITTSMDFSGHAIPYGQSAEQPFFCDEGLHILVAEALVRMADDR
jgi:hypothetical protein